MRTQVFSPTYPTWALVGGTSRPAGETVLLKFRDFIDSSNSTRFVRYMMLLEDENSPMGNNRMAAARPQRLKLSSMSPPQ